MKYPAANQARIDTRSDHGQTSAEYSVLLALVLLVVAAAVTVLNGAVLSVLGRVAGALS